MALTIFHGLKAIVVTLGSILSNEGCLCILNHFHNLKVVVDAWLCLVERGLFLWP